MKQITIAGNLGKDAEVRSTQQGDKVAGFSVAVKDRDGTVWFDVKIWGKRGEALAQYLTKGTPVCVTGDLGTREHNGKTYLTVRASEITLMGGKRDDRSDDRMSPTARAADRAQRPDRGSSHDPALDDEIPF